MRETEAAWLAGLIDGEGHVGFTLSRKAQGDYYQPRLSIAMTHEETIERVCELTGAVKRLNSHLNRPNASPTWLWQCPMSSMERTLREVQPFMFTKKEAVDLMILYFGCRKDRAMSDIIVQQVRSLTATARQGRRIAG